MLEDVMLPQKRGQGVKEMQIMEVDTAGNIRHINILVSYLTNHKQLFH